MDAGEFQKKVETAVSNRYVEDRSLLSFDEYLLLFLKNPRHQSRWAAQYIIDVFDYFGFCDIATPVGCKRRFNLFDAPLFNGRGRVAGQEQVQNDIYRILRNFVRQGRADRLILLHGPNGSAKSSVVSAIMAGLEAYSRIPEGAVYRFNWVFPNEKMVKGSIGFGGKKDENEKRAESFAHLEGEDIEARLICDMKDHPLLLIPKEDRRKILEQAYNAGIIEIGPREGCCDEAARCGKERYVLPEYLLWGELCHKCRTIHDALMASYGGDWSRVMSHVQVERFYYSRKYLHGAVVVEPQLSVDAQILSMQRSSSSLPASLQSATMVEVGGPLVNANRGIVEYSDLLKRPVDHFKYLLGTSETSEVRMEHVTLQIDEVLIATSNEIHLAAFKEYPDWASFKGRIELVKVPYLRRLEEEIEIYRDQIREESVGRHIAPHTLETAAMWAVLTRLKKPSEGNYSKESWKLLEKLSPLEKLELYDTGTAPSRFSIAQAKEIRALCEELYNEYETDTAYEGREGASAREIKTALLNAAQHPGRECVTPRSVIDDLKALVKETSVYAFLQEEKDQEYHGHSDFIGAVEERWIDRVDDEVREALGLVAEQQYTDWFERYVHHVTAWVRNEKIRNRITGEDEPPDEDMMKEMEEILMSGDSDREEFRRGIISSIGAYRIENPEDSGEALVFSVIFPDLFRRLRDRYHEQHKKEVREMFSRFLKMIDAEESGKKADTKEFEQIINMLDELRDRFGYCDHCSRDVVFALMKKRYRD